VFLLLGVLGFVPGITTKSMLFGTFRVSALHNLVHLALGAGIVLARTSAGARSYLTGAGIAALALWLLGVSGLLDRLPANAADNWLHLLLGLGLLALLALASRQDLGHDLERDLGGGLAAEIEADRPAH
jgi:uncharacterized protein DUF4383